jgi:3-oxoacyl-[acyl-carrier protein] reductase
VTRTLGEAWGEDGIRVNGIASGLIETKLTKVTTENAKRREGVEQKVPLKRLGHHLLISSGRRSTSMAA